MIIKHKLFLNSKDIALLNLLAINGLVMKDCSVWDNSFQN